MADARPMWSLQREFRRSVAAAAERALQLVGADLAPDAFVVGFPDDRPTSRVVLVGGDGAFTAADLAGVPQEADRLLAESPVHAQRFTDPEVRKGHLERAADTARGQALADAMQKAPAGEGRTFFVGQSAPVAGYTVHPVASVDQRRLEALPRLHTTRVDDTPVTVSMPHGVVTELLRTATHALLAANPPRSISPVEDDVPADAVRRAANHMVFSAALVAGGVLAKGLFDSFDALAATAYEGRAGSGTVVVAREDHPYVDVAIRLRSPIPVEERLPFRKLLELTDTRLGLLVDGTRIYGLGGISEEYDGSSEDLFLVAVTEPGVWTLSHHDAPLLRVANGRAQLPRPRMSASLFRAAMREVFHDTHDTDVEAVWRLAQTAVREGRGTMLVVTTAAAQEAERLAPQAIAVEPQPIGSRMLRALTRIDGAVLLTPDGTCHAVGAILDGTATGVGDPGRGSRYNSAVRYTAASAAPCLIVIVSDDGMIDVHPAPRETR